MRASPTASILVDIIHIVALAWQNPCKCTPRDAQPSHVECVCALCKVAHAGHRAPDAACIDTSGGMEGILTRLGMEAQILAFQKVHMPPCKAAVPLHLCCVSLSSSRVRYRGHWPYTHNLQNCCTQACHGRHQIEL